MPDLLFARPAGFACCPSSPASARAAPYGGQQGFQAGDTHLFTWTASAIYIYRRLDLLALALRTRTHVYDIVVLRDGEKVDLDDFRAAQVPYDAGGRRHMSATACTSASEPETFGYHAGMRLVSAPWTLARMVRLSLGDLFTGQVGLQDMSGPVGIVSAIVRGGRAGLTTVRHGGAEHPVSRLRFIAVNLAVMNLLPIPALDGGRVVCLLITACW